MELNAINKLISMFPEGPKKEALIAKLSKLQAKENTSGGLHDEFSLKPKGHIMIEEIDGNGQVLGILADQPNLVVDGAEEILLRAFSGDPKRMLYKNRKIKEYKEGSTVITGKSPKFHSKLTAVSTVLNGEDVVAQHQNEIWKDVDDSSFEIEYSYYPNTLYVKQELVSDEPNKITFRVYDKASAPAGSAPLQAEVHSTFSNLFIGLGDGVNKNIALTDERLKFTNSLGAAGGWSIKNDIQETVTTNDKLTIEEKISNVEFTFLKSNVGGQVEIFINGASKGVIDLYKSSLIGSATEDLVVSFKELILEEASKVEVKFIGADSQVVGTPKIAIKAIKFDAFKKSDNGLHHEFDNFTLKLDTPATYNTTSEVNSGGTYTINLEHFPVVAESVAVEYNSLKLQRVDALSAVVSGKYFVDKDKGIVHFKNPLTGLLVTYDVTGEIFEDEPKTKLTAANTSIPIETETNGSALNLSGQLNGAKVRFSFNKTKVVSGSTVITYDPDGSGASGVVTLVKDVDYTLDSASGEFELIIGSKIQAIPNYPAYLNVTAFKYMNPSTKSLPTLSMILANEVRGREIKVKDHEGTELVYVATEAELAEGKYTVSPVSVSDTRKKKLIVAKYNNAAAQPANEIQKIDVFYYSDEKPGVPTNYTRQVILKPKTDNEYPWFALDKGSVVFTAEFEEGTPSNNVTIREMGLFDGPRIDDKVRGFAGYPVKAFSLVRVGDTRKEASTGLRITWTITLLNEKDQPFKGGL